MVLLLYLAFGGLLLIKKYKEFMALGDTIPETIRARRMQEVQDSQSRIESFREMATQDIQKQQFNYGNTEAINLEIRMKNPNDSVISHNYIHRDILLPNESIEFTFTDYNNFYSPLGAQLTWHVEISYKNSFESTYITKFDVQAKMINHEKFKILDDKFSIEKVKKEKIKTAKFSAEIINNSISKINF